MIDGTVKIRNTVIERIILFVEGYSFADNARDLKRQLVISPEVLITSHHNNLALPSQQKNSN